MNRLFNYGMALLVGFLFGWWDAHSVVARECKQLGAFYVGRQVFDCKAQAQKEQP